MIFVYACMATLESSWVREQLGRARESKISSTENSSGPTHLRNRAINGRWSLRKSLQSWKSDRLQLSIIVMNKFALGCGVLIAILLFVVVVAAIAIGGNYNRLVRLQQAVDQSWAQVQNVYQRRADLIPNLVNTVSGAANFEKSTLV